MQDKDKSVETMKGVFLSSKKGYQSEIKDYSLTILIDDPPFNAEISVEIDTDEWNQYVNYDIASKWKGILDNHPEICNRNDCYFNSQEGAFYMASTTDDKGNPIWQKSTLEKIVYASYRAFRLRRHIHRDYNRYHAGQRCEFQAYAIDANDNLYKPSSIKKDFHEYQWIFYPTTFKAGEISKDTIKYLVERQPISKETTDNMVRYHQEQDKIKQQKEDDDKKKKEKEKRDAFWNKINAHIEKYEKIYKYGVGIGILWLLSAILQLWAILTN